MNISAEEFLKTARKKKQSKLEPFKTDILKLKNAKVSNIEICRFLKLNGVETTQGNLGHFLKKLKPELSEKIINKSTRTIEQNNQKTEPVQKKMISNNQNDHTVDKISKADAITHNEQFSSESQHKPVPAWAKDIDINNIY